MLNQIGSVSMLSTSFGTNATRKSNRLRVFTAASVLVFLSLSPACKGKEEDPAQVQQLIVKMIEEGENKRVNFKLVAAEKRFRDALDLDPQCSAALCGIGEIRLEQKNYAEAENFLSQAIAADPNNAQAHAAIGKLHAANEKFEQSAEAYGKAYALKSDNSLWALEYGTALRKANRLGEAEKILRKVAEDDPKVQYVFSELGDTLRLQKKFDEALKVYMQAQNTYASDKAARAGAALIYESKGETTLAINEWSDYIRMDCCSTYSNSVAKPKIASLRAIESGETPAAPAEDSAENQARQAQK